MKLFEVYPLFPIEIVRGKNSQVWDQNGNEYLDFYGGHAVISIGHSHPNYVSAIQEQVAELGFYSNAVINGLQLKLANTLSEVTGYADFQLFLVNSGAEAIESALKVASFVNQRKKVLSFRKAFHGRTSLAVSATDNKKIHAPINQTDYVDFFQFDQFDEIEKALKSEQYAAVVVEGLQGIAGIYEVPDELLVKLRKWTTETGTLLILDEIQSGYGRTGSFFAHQNSGIVPDMVTIAKGMGNGFPIGGVLIHANIKAWHGMLGTTFGGNHLACAAAISVLETIQNEKLVSKAMSLGQFLKEELLKLKKIKEVRGRGLMLGVAFDFPAKEIRDELLKQFNIFTGNASDPNVIRLLPPLTISKEQCEYFIQSLKSCLDE